jgi:ribosomal protein S18 acetylase RimI-like enzyme
MNITVKLLEAGQITNIQSGLARAAWSTPPGYFETLLAEQTSGVRDVLVAYLDKVFAGYVTIKWQSDYPPFAEKVIPEINDLRVLPDFRRRGIATALVDEAEARIFARSPVAGIGVGLYAHYGPAQRMYVRRGYVPDGLGLYYQEHHVAAGQDVRVDDELNLYFIKECRQGITLGH